LKKSLLKNSGGGGGREILRENKLVIAEQIWIDFRFHESTGLCKKTKIDDAEDRGHKGLGVDSYQHSTSFNSEAFVASDGKKGVEEGGPKRRGLGGSQGGGGQKRFLRFVGKRHILRSPHSLGAIWKGKEKTHTPERGVSNNSDKWWELVAVKFMDSTQWEKRWPSVCKKGG